MSPLQFLTSAMEFGGIKRNYLEHKKNNHKDIEQLIKITEKLFESHERLVTHELNILKENKELRKRLGEENRF